MNYFEILQITPHPCPNLELVQKQYFALQQKFHPDLQNIDDSNFSSELNLAYQTLSNPFLASCYWLKLHAIDIFSESCEIKPTTAILQEVFTLNNSINASNKIAVKNDLQQKINLALQNILPLYQNYLNNQPNSLIDFALHLIKIQYYQKTLNNIYQL
jgi:molecular chaperone HscB